MRLTILLLTLIVGAVLAGYWLGYAPDEGVTPDVAPSEAERPLGPVDGFDLPATDLERVALGTQAPDFRLMSYAGDVLSLSDYRGSKDVVLVFYRGHW